MAILRLALILGCLASLSVDAEIYSWVDEEGTRHFGDEPPVEDAREVREEKIELHNIDRGYPPGVVVDPERETRKREKARQQAAAVTEKREICGKARRELDVLSGRVIFKDEQGNEIQVSEKERAEMARRFRAQIAEYCDQ